MKVIGIDPGVSTGIAVWDIDRGDFDFIKTVSIDVAWNIVQDIKPVVVLVEDARKRDNFYVGPHRSQGAGSIKRDCSAWEKFLKRIKFNYEMIHPKYVVTKLDAKSFERATGWTQKTSVHGRDAGMLVYGLTLRNILIYINNF